MSGKKILCCGILRHELEYLLANENVEIRYLDAALHVNLDKLANEITNALKQMSGDNISLVIGNQCHPEMEDMAAARGGRVIQAKSCIEMLLGEKMAEMDAEAKTFYLTSGWLENWRKIFMEGLGWDAVDARQNFGYYDRILLLDTGIVPIDEINLLEFYDYTQVPIETISVDLGHLHRLLKQVLNG
ncbi:DUF1638 domain-containing protein [Desulfurispora thermophila]|uniref:DUF1638 domain-containing protein n=1 Tax=Desulfurispora thermophila TaxID=265470 RepID=UPI00035F9844|nr:DUF1638 domain-containing protein [Desulfurispora thermophila]